MIPRRHVLLVLVCWLALESTASSGTALNRCLDAHHLPRVARVLGPDHHAEYVRVLGQSGGVPTVVAPLPEEPASLAAVFDAAILAGGPDEAREIWELPIAEASQRLCSPVSMPQAEIDAEEKVIVAAGLNYAAHAEEAGGGDVFLFPKPVEPTAPYAFVAPPKGVTLLDYEVELAFVLLEEIDLEALPSAQALLAKTAYFVANDVTDREPIIRHKPASGPGTGFIDAKGRRSFFPAGPWMVRGTELFRALEACGAAGLGLRLEVDEGDGFVTRQASDTSLMILEPHAMLEQLAAKMKKDGRYSEMPARFLAKPRFYPMATPPGFKLPAGSVLLTGTPDGVALSTPSVPGLVARGLMRLRGPIQQFLEEELERAKVGAPGGFLAVEDRMRASIDGLGSQTVTIRAAGSEPPVDPCTIDPTE